MGTALWIFGMNGGPATQLMIIRRASLTFCGARCIKVRLVWEASLKWRGYKLPLSRTDRGDFKNPTPKSGSFILRMGFMLVSNGRADIPPRSVISFLSLFCFSYFFFISSLFNQDLCQADGSDVRCSVSIRYSVLSVFLVISEF